MTPAASRPVAPPRAVVLPALVGPRGGGIGGTAAYVEALAPRLRARGLRVTVLGHGEEADRSPDFVPLVRRAAPRGRDLSLALWRHRRTHDFPPDTVIHVQRPDHGMGFLGGPWPLVVSFHGLHRRNVAARGRAADWVYGRITRRVTRRADALVFATEADRAEALGTAAALREKSVLVPNGVDRERFRPADRDAARRALGLPVEARAVGFVGRHAPEKNLSALIDAVERVPGLELWIAGRGPETGALRARAGERVRFLGFLDPEDLPRFHAALDGLALASFHEGLPTVVLEAWASGRPVVVPAVTGLADLLADGGGMLAARPDADALAATLAGFAERIATGVPAGWSPEALRERSRPYDWDTIVDSMLAVYAAAAERRCAS